MDSGTSLTHSLVKQELQEISDLGEPSEVIFAAFEEIVNLVLRCLMTRQLG